MSLQEAGSFPKLAGDGLPSLSRQLYIHALTYLLRGLPVDLSPEEQLCIRSAIPFEIVDSFTVRPFGDKLLAAHAEGFRPFRESDAEPSVIHRLLASGIIHTCFLIQLLLPYVKLLVGQMYRFEREHHISEKIFSMSINTVDELGKRSLEITNAICRMNNGKVGQALAEFASWWVREVAGGVHEGIVEGMVVITGPKFATSKSSS